MTVSQASFTSLSIASIGQDIQLVNTTPSLLFDPYYYYVNILCSFDLGIALAIDSSIFQSNKLINPNAATVTSNNSKWGTTSLQVSYQDWRVDPWTGTRYGFRAAEEYTIEFWWKHVSNTYNSQTAPPLVRVGGTSGTSWSLNKYGTAVNTLGVLQPFQDNQFVYTSAPDGWNHIACVVTHNIADSQDYLKVYVNGVLGFTNQVGNTGANSASYILLGGNSDTIDHPCQDFISDFRVTKGIARYTSNFLPPTAAFPAIGPYASADPYFPFVTANVHFDGTPVDTSWRAQTLTNQGVVIDTVTPKFGTGAWSGVGQDVSNRERATSTPYSWAHNFAEYDGCAELWVKSPEHPTSGFLFNIDGNSLAAYFQQNSGTGAATNNLAVLYHGFQIGVFDVLTGYGNVWQHLAFVKQGETFKCYRNGTLLATMTNPYGTNNNASSVCLGFQYFTGGTNPNGTRTAGGSLIGGEIDDFRLTIGTPRYTADFTPPAQANPDGVTISQVDWLWDFGDSTTNNTFQPTKSYTISGYYLIHLTASNVSGFTEITHGITIIGPLTPAAAFTFSPSTGVAPVTVSFVDVSTNTPTSWQWDFGDGTISVLQNPSHTYLAGGIYSVTLIAGNNYGTGAISQSITIVSPSIVEFSAGLMSVLPENILISGPSSDQVISQIGLLSNSTYSVASNADGHLYIMKGVVPSTPDLTSIPFTDVLIDFSIQSGSMVIQSGINPVVISTTYMSAIATGTATWFLLTSSTQTGTIFQQAIGTIGVSGSGSDLEISDTSIISGNFYRTLDIRIFFNSVWS